MQRQLALAIFWIVAAFPAGMAACALLRLLLPEEDGLAITRPRGELMCGLCCCLMVFRFGAGLPAAAACVLMTILCACAFIDGRLRRVPDRLVILGCTLGVAFSAADGLGGLAFCLCGGVVCAGLPLLFALLGERRGRSVLGGGDIKLFFLLGLFSGWAYGLFAMLLASVLGAARAAYRLGRHKDAEPLPFSPLLLAGAALSLLFGELVFRPLGLSA